MDSLILDRLALRLCPYPYPYLKACSGMTEIGCCATGYVFWGEGCAFIDRAGEAMLLEEATKSELTSGSFPDALISPP